MARALLLFGNLPGNYQKLEKRILKKRSAITLRTLRLAMAEATNSR